jgi:hypothetical protein
MTTWRAEIESAMAAFHSILSGAGEALDASECRTEFCDAPHLPPKRLPSAMVAVYGFWGDGRWLKLGKAGPKTRARYTSQHYQRYGAPSTLARSLAEDPRMASVAGFDPVRPGEWIRAATHRVNILLPETCNGPVLALLEAYLHLRLRPRYEGRRGE